MDDLYRWDENSYQALAAAGVPWPEASYVLRHGHPRIRQHIGAVLRVYAAARDGRWLVVALIEEHDDEYLVVGGRWLDPDEQEAAQKTTERDQ